MLIFYYGPDNYRAKAKIAAIRDKYREKFPTAFALRTFSTPAATPKDVQQFLETDSLFEEKKLAVLENFWTWSKNDRETLLKLALIYRDDRATVIIVQADDHPRRNDAVFKTLLQQARAESFELLSRSQLYHWLDGQLKKQGFDLRPPARKMLLDWTGPDLWRLQNELAKLCFWAQSRQQEQKPTVSLSETDVRFLVVPRFLEKVFGLSDALNDQDPAGALRALRGLVNSGEPPLKILSFLVTYYRGLLMVKDSQRSSGSGAVSPSDLGLHPFVFQKARQAVRVTDKNTCLVRLRRLLKLDQAIKSGRLQRPEEGLELFLLRVFCDGTARS